VRSYNVYAVFFSVIFASKICLFVHCYAGWLHEFIFVYSLLYNFVVAGLKTRQVPPVPAETRNNSQGNYGNMED